MAVFLCISFCCCKKEEEVKRTPIRGSLSETFQCLIYEEEDANSKTCEYDFAPMGEKEFKVISKRATTNMPFLELDFGEGAEPANLYLYDKLSGWTKSSTLSGIFKVDSFCLSNSDGTFLFSDMPKAYKDLGSGVVEKVAECGELLIQEGKLIVSSSCDKSFDYIDAFMCKGNGEYFEFPADESLITDDTNGATVWKSYLEDNEAKWLFDGYYRELPDMYSPKTDGEGYYLCPASFISKGLLDKLEDNPENMMLCYATLDTMMLHQREDGSLRTLPISDWLLEDYGIGGGFYDTRFNTDLFESVYRLSKETGYILFEKNINSYIDFYLNISDKIDNSKDANLIFMPDYYQESETSIPWTSLNHQAAECTNLYHLASVMGNGKAAEVADMLFAGLEATAEDWIKGDRDLFYARNIDGTYEGQDYYDLTYYDLIDLQNCLATRGKHSNVLQTVINSKYKWISNN